MPTCSFLLPEDSPWKLSAPQSMFWKIPEPGCFLRVSRMGFGEREKINHLSFRFPSE